MRIPKPSNQGRLFCILVMMVLSGLFFIGGPDFHSPRSYKAAWNLGHIVYFALLPLLLYSFKPTTSIKPIVQALYVIGLTILVGIIVELIQYGLNRIPDMHDIFRNIIGAFVAIFFFLPIRKSIPNTALYASKVLVIGLVVLQTHPVFKALIDEHHARRDFPILSDFQTPFQINRWIGTADFTVEEDSNNFNQVMRVDLKTSEYSGVRLKYFPRNWTSYRWFQFRVYNPLPVNLNLTCRIHDKEHDQGLRQFDDRFNKTCSISQGWNTIRISIQEVMQAPKTRHMNLKQIHEIAFFTFRLPGTRMIYLDDIKLLR